MLSSAKPRDIREVIVLFPTPPLPERMRILFFTEDNLSFTRAFPGSSCFVAPDAHILWFGQPAHAETLPALSLSVPGQSKNAQLSQLHIRPINGLVIKQKPVK